MTHALADVIDRAWEGRDALSTDTRGEVREVVDAALDLLGARRNSARPVSAPCRLPPCAGAPSSRKMRC